MSNDSLDRNENGFCSLENGHIIFSLNTVCKHNNEEKLREALEKFKLEKINLRIIHEFIYYLIKKYKAARDDSRLEFSRTYSRQDLIAEKIGEYLD